MFSKTKVNNDRIMRKEIDLRLNRNYANKSLYLNNENQNYKKNVRKNQTCNILKRKENEKYLVTCVNN